MLSIHPLVVSSAMAAATLIATAAAAQSPYASPYASPYSQSYPAFQPASDADQLTAQLRILAADPANVAALVAAGRLSLKLGDTDGAAALYTRAEKVDPRNPQVKAGMGRLLVQSERPGEALRLFDQAQLLGANEADFGSDRALAYDLIGQQERAQRAYRALLKRGADDEATRRYALSLGISGLKEPALALLEPLNRRSDRGAWRARAFVLAMTGDRRGADQIATTMMPAGMAGGLDAFFDRLPKLSVIDRAFAVHFGEVRGNAARLADARLVPPLPALSPEPNPFPPAARTVQVAALDTNRKKSKRSRREPAAVQVAIAQPYVAPLPPPPTPTAGQLASLSAGASGSYGLRRNPTQLAGRGVTVLPPPADAYVVRPDPRPSGAMPVQLAAADDGGDDGPDEPVATVASVRPVAAPTTGTASLAMMPPPATTVASTAKTTPGTVFNVPVPGTPAVSLPAVAPPVAVAATPPVTTVAAIPSTTVAPPLASQLAATAPAVADNVSIVNQPAARPVETAAISPATGAPPAPAGATGDTVLAEIIAKIDVPAAERRDATPAPIGRTKLLAAAETRADARAVVDRARADAARPEPALRTDARGRYVDARGKPLLDARGRPLTARAATAALQAGNEAGEATPPTLKKDARGRYLDARGKPLLDDRGRPLGPKAAAAALLAGADDIATTAPTLRKDARGRYLAADGKPLLDERGRPLGPKAAAAALANANDATPPALKKDARGRYVDARGKPLLDERGRPLGPKAAAAALADVAADDDKPAARLKQDARGRYLDARGKPLLDARGRPLDAKSAAAALKDGPAADTKRKPDAKGEPQRYWVQVAGGANEADLGKAWQRVSSAAPALKGKQGWTTPLRATNRVLTGPFKSSDEAMAMVGQLKKQGVSAFMFTSDPGQKVTRLGAK